MKYVTVAVTFSTVFLLATGCSELGQDVDDAATAQCGICHSIPPATAQHKVHVDTLEFDCDACHEGNSADPLEVAETHHDGDTNVAFSGYWDPSMAGSFNKASRTCDNLYCHGNFEEGNTVSIQIGDHASCGSCHGDPAEHLAITQNPYHAIHAGQYDKKCQACHAGYYGRYGINDSLHCNRQIDVTFGDAFDPKGTGQFNQSQQSCSNVYCHGNFYQGTGATVSLDDAIGGRCTACHDTAAIAGGHHGFDRTNHDIMDCNQCHSGYSITSQTIDSKTHANGVVDIKNQLPF
ncbi:MAG: hypothetical protein GF401_07695 [Chitinivibrionales bacterium]|nr:hypothetical protein [Chitinivibrionales bacterium]